MKRKFAVLTVIVLCGFWSQAALAEGNCPPGYYPIGDQSVQGCAPIPGAGTQQGDTYIPPDPGPKWAKRWGAFAGDGKASAVGFANNISSKRKAHKVALSDCKSKGGKKCKVMHTYYNQCGAASWGESAIMFSSGPEIDETQQRAQRKCSALTTDCEVVYTGCSYPVQIR